ncbi:nitrate reductase molybdenum cofactor assembly chaperone [Spongiactinospora rosea]|uniref:Nitrate reductase molybdenum cofactor assembly chaperone n=1 Tax=Spongiactinospora rosea TaxID=2248750 RepID=A0A366LZV7_9ACTN|nr:nitrate reductase molybdenum cofactor assembly chaperone [Spongiactinospora rosea]RBQ18844.1 nitrate reductase molybdenum cofactor assembly chaperone [Spongiactinospora rosea]
MTAPAVHQAASLLLCYPGEGWERTRDLVAAALAPLPGEAAAALRRFCAAAARSSPLELGTRYVATFDRTRRRTLHMTYYIDGDTRRRGMSLARIKALYRAHGWRPEEAELPDFLPLMLEFAARCPDPGTALLHRHRAGLDLLGAALASYGSAYADVVLAVTETLGEPSAEQRRLAQAIAEEGPPAESVGPAPFTMAHDPAAQGART